MIFPVTSGITSSILQGLLDVILFSIFIFQDEGIDSTFNKLLTVSDSTGTGRPEKLQSPLEIFKPHLDAFLYNMLEGNCFNRGVH